MYTCNPSSQEAEAQGHQGYMVKPCLKKSNKKVYEVICIVYSEVGTEWYWMNDTEDVEVFICIHCMSFIFYMYLSSLIVMTNNKLNFKNNLLN